jgi:hypothetical protein
VSRGAVTITVAAIPVPGEKSSQEIDADRSHDLVRGFPANGL